MFYLTSENCIIYPEKHIVVIDSSHVEDVNFSTSNGALISTFKQMIVSVGFLASFLLLVNKRMAYLIPSAIFVHCLQLRLQFDKSNQC